MKKLALVTLGCNKNQVDSEFLINGLVDFFEITGDLEKADVIVLSPCSFLEVAREEARDYILDLQEYKKHKCKCLVVTGCFAEHQKENLLTQFDAIDLVVGLTNPQDFAHQISIFLTSHDRKFIKNDNTNFGIFSDNPSRVVSHPFSAYVKISDGCNNCCSYCLIPTIRGNFRSRAKEVILKEVETLLKNGVKEINIVSQDIGMYGQDIYGKNCFIDLINAISELKYDFFIRLLYLHPKHINQDLVELLKNNPKVLKYLDIPIQHINDEILESMNRKITKAEIIEKLDMLRVVKDLVIRTTFIIGYPLENDARFEELKIFVKEQKFDKLGVFAFSNEKGTKAFDDFGDELQIPSKIKQKRIFELMKIQKQISFEKNRKLLDSDFCYAFFDKILDNKTALVRLFSMAPEVDGYVKIKVPKNCTIAPILKIKITKAKEYDLEGEIVQ